MFAILNCGIVPFVDNCNKYEVWAVIRYKSCMTHGAFYLCGWSDLGITEEPLFRFSFVRWESRLQSNKSLLSRQNSMHKRFSFRKKVGIGISPGSTSGALTHADVCLNRHGLESL